MKTTMFKVDMLIAVLDLSKDQTRRLDGLHEINKNPDGWIIYRQDGNKFIFKGGAFPYDYLTINSKYKVGDIVGIKESFEILEYQRDKIILKYLLDDETTGHALTREEHKKFIKWKNKLGVKSKLFMFDSMIRYKIQITDIRLERVQYIGDCDIRKEGTKLYGLTRGKVYLREAFRELWDSINKKRGYGWEVNPWVFVVSFKKIGGENK